MQSRMDRYNTIVPKDKEASQQKEVRKIGASRQQKNQDLYKEVSNTEIEHFDINNNVSIIGDNADNIDIDQVRDILDRRYKTNVPKNKSIGTAVQEDVVPIRLDETREYDLNTVLKQAKSSKEINYEEDRLRKLHNTQYDILMKLDIKKEEDVQKKANDIKEFDVSHMTIEEAESITSVNEIPEEDLKKASQNVKPSEKKLLDLIDTITSKEALISKEDYPFDEEDDATALDPLDLLSDLRGNEDTRVLGAAEITAALTAVEETEDTVPIPQEEDRNDKDSVSIDKTFSRSNNRENLQENIDSTKTDNLHLTHNQMFKTNDFEEFKDIKDDMKVTKILIKILIVIIVLVFIFGIVMVVNKYLHLGLF